MQVLLRIELSDWRCHTDQSHYRFTKYIITKIRSIRVADEEVIQVDFLINKLQESLNSMSVYALILESIIYFKKSMLKLPAMQYGKALELKCSITSLKEFSNIL